MTMKDKGLGIYVGQFKDSKRHGVGQLILSHPEEERNTIIEAQFRNNHMNGYGRVIFNDGTHFEGMFKDNLILYDGHYTLK